MKPGRGGAGENLRDRLAPRRGKPGLGGHADHLGVVIICKDQTGVGWQKIGRKRGIYRPEKPVAPIQIALPFAVRLKISAGGFAFDHPDFPLGAKRHDINTQARGWHKFFDAGKSKRAKVATGAAG